jgi:hypothetical protein
VNLENNSFGDSAGCLLVTLLSEYSKILETLIFRNTQIQVHTIAALCLLIDGKDTPFPDRPLANLSIGKNSFGQEELCKFFISISENKTLRILDISGLNLST